MKKKTVTKATNATKATKKKVNTSEAAENVLLESFDPGVINALKALLASEAQDENSYLMKELTKRFNRKEEEEKANPKKDLGFPQTSLDDDERKIGSEYILGAAKKLKKEACSATAWVTIILDKEYSPRAIYRAAFELAGYEIDWEYNTHRALTWLDHHGYKIERIA